jgi:hypothetical protein
MVMLSFAETMVYFKGFSVIIQLSFLVHTIFYWYDNDRDLSFDAGLYISTSKRTQQMRLTFELLSSHVYHLQARVLSLYCNIR